MGHLIIDKGKKATGEVVCGDISKAGSGFLVDTQGSFITNNHVVSKMSIDMHACQIGDWSD